MLPVLAILFISVPSSQGTIPFPEFDEFSNLSYYRMPDWLQKVLKDDVVEPAMELLTTMDTAVYFYEGEERGRPRRFMEYKAGNNIKCFSDSTSESHYEKTLWKCGVNLKYPPRPVRLGLGRAAPAVNIKVDQYVKEEIEKLKTYWNKMKEARGVEAAVGEESKVVFKLERKTKPTSYCKLFTKSLDHGQKFEEIEMRCGEYYL